MLGGFRILPEGSRFRARDGDLVINWGRSNLPPYPSARVLNSALNVGRAVNKCSAFWHFNHSGVPTVDTTEDINVAMAWTQDGHTVLERTA